MGSLISSNLLFLVWMVKIVKEKLSKKKKEEYKRKEIKQGGKDWDLV